MTGGMRFHVEAVTGAEMDVGISSPSDDQGHLMASIFFCFPIQHQKGGPLANPTSCFDLPFVHVVATFSSRTGSRE
jgi:hypothetical protein